LLSQNSNRSAAALKSSSVVQFPEQPALQLIYDTAPIGLACLSPDCRYLQINQRLTEICGISVEDHLGRSVRDCVPGLADAVEGIVRSIMETGDPVTGIEVAGQRADQTDERFWITYWHPLRSPRGEIVGVNVAAEEITERKRAEAALQASERQFHTLADSIPQLVWMAETGGRIFWFNSRWHEYTGMPIGETNSHDWQAILAPASLQEARQRWARALHQVPNVLIERFDLVQQALGRIEARQTAEVTPGDLENAEFKVSSQWGEDGIIEHLVRNVAIEREIFVEFGVHVAMSRPVQRFRPTID